MSLMDFFRRRSDGRCEPVDPVPLNPQPEYRTRRLAQFSEERRARYFDNIRKAGL